MQEGKEWIVTALTNYLDKKKYRKEKFLEKVKNFFQKKSNFCQKFEIEKKYQNKNFDLGES